MSDAIVLQAVSFGYGGAAAPTLRSISLRLAPGGRLVLFGSNGAGKTTLLRLIAGRRRPTSGQVTVLGKPAFETTELAMQVTLVTEEWQESLCTLPVRELLESCCATVPAGGSERAAQLVIALGIDAALLEANLA